MLLPGQTVLVSVSGGPDSTCLLHALNLLRRLLKVKLAVFHFDHGLRPDSKDDAAYVRRQAARLKVPVYVRQAVAKPPRGASVEHWAREARLAAVSSVIRESGAERVAVGHTVDDQAETMLIAVLRGDGLDGLAGIRPVLGPFVQPLLDTTRDEVEAFCRSMRLRPRQDPTNRDTRLLRNAIRLRAIPAVERATRRSVRAPLARSASLLRTDADELHRRAVEAANELLDDEPDGLVIPAAALASLPRAIGSRVVRLALYRLGALPEMDHVLAVLDLAAGRPGRRRDIGGLLAERGREYVRLARPSPGS